MENRKSSTFNFHFFTTFFSDTYASWQRCTNKNINGLLREFYSKKFDFYSINQKELDAIVTVINNRPSKCLGIITHFILNRLYIRYKLLPYINSTFIIHKSIIE